MEAAQKAYTAPGDLEMEAQKRVKEELLTSGEETESESNEEDEEQPP